MPLSQFASTVDNNLYKTHKREMGLQFFKNCLGLSPLGIQLIIDWHNVTDKIPFW